MHILLIQMANGSCGGLLGTKKVYEWHEAIAECEVIKDQIHLRGG